MAETDKTASVLSTKLNESDSVDVANATPLAMSALFPDFNCLRCGAKSFWVTQSRGAPNIVIGKNEVNRSQVELICDNCGMIETHSAAILINSAWKKISEGGNGQQG